jgi:uncharacterized RDD family membrane protein YckC
MTDNLDHKQSESGALYDLKDYIGFWRRFGIVTVDLIVFAVIAVILSFIVGLVAIAAGMAEDDPRIGAYSIVAALAAALVYFPVLKSTRIGTVGYRFFKARLVDLKGRQASVVKSFLRFSFVAIGPFNWLLDLIWLSGFKHKQAFRDLFVGTYVIRRDAEPIGRSSIVHPTYDVLGWHFTCSEVKDDRD